MADRPLPPWAGELPEGAFISYEPTYKVGEYFSRFHRASFKPSDFAEMGYYFYDPTEHGFEAGREYPLFVFMHGTSNALFGDICINYAGAEFYSKEEYQKKIGGAYLLLPLANEYRDIDGFCRGSWNESYVKPVYELICDFIETVAEKKGGVSKKVIFGNSSGATMCFLMVNAYTDFFNALIPIGSGSIPDDKTLERYEVNDVHFFLAIGKHDELNSYEELIAPRLPRLKRMKHCFIFTPEWVYNGDHGVASINNGIEMGQHCLINPMHCNLMFDDGSPMEASLPEGIVGWLAQMLQE